MKKLLSLVLISSFLFPQFVFAKRLVSLSAEWQAVTAADEEVLAVYTPSIDTTIKNGGAASFEFSGTVAASTANGMDHDFRACTKCYVRWYVYIDTLTNTGLIANYMDLVSTATNVISVQITNTSGTYTVTPYYNEFGGSLTPFEITPEDGWHYMEVLYDSTPANGSEVFTVKWDGVQQATDATLTYTLKSVTNNSQGVYNGSAGDETASIVYFDDIAVNDTTEQGQTSYPGVGKMVILVPTGDGDSACTDGTWDDINEIPPSDTATAGGTDICELDTTTSTASFAMTDSATAGIDSYDTISYVTPRVRVREETAGTTNYGMGLISATGGTATTSPVGDAGDATTVRTNPISTTKFLQQMFGTTTDPTTHVAWTPTGTNSIDNLQLQIRTTDGSPDTWVTTAMVLVEYVDGAAPPSGGGASVNSVIDDNI